MSGRLSNRPILSEEYHLQRRPEFYRRSCHLLGHRTCRWLYYTGKKTTTRAVADFLGKYFAPDFPAFKDKPFAMKFYEIFRHGLAHGWSPKAGGVAMDFRRDWALRFIKTQDGSEKIPSLNIPTFFEITKKALQGFESDLDKDRNLQAKFARRYKVLIDGDYKAMREFREMFLRLKRPSETKSV